MKKQWKVCIKEHFEQGINEPFFVQFKKQEIILLMKKSNLQKEFQNMILVKVYYDKLSDQIEFHVDDMDYFDQLAQDLPLKGKHSVRKNPRALISIVAGKYE